MFPEIPSLPNMTTVRTFINQALDEMEAIDVNVYTNSVHSAVTFQWVKAEWFQWRNHYVPIAILVAFFWPVVVTLLLALTAASTWLFWLVTSLLFGVLQLIYVMYQFGMIFSDILILSGFKTYSMLRSQLLFWLGKSGLHEARHSRRRVWKKKLGDTGSYERFLQIPIEQKLQSEVVIRKPKRRNSLKHMIMRSNSFGEIENASSPRKRADSISRNKSFDTRIENRLMSSFSEDSSSEDYDLNDTMIREEMGKTGVILAQTTARLREARLEATQEGTAEAVHSLTSLLSGVVKRNHLSLDEVLVENGRSVADTGKFGLSQEARSLIREYYEEVQRGLDWIADSPLDTDQSDSAPVLGFLGNAPVEAALTDKARVSLLQDRITLVRKLKQNMGRTALMLSGGGAQAMYHLGTIRSLVESKLYDDIKVISGTSGGSITAAMCAMKTADELFKDVCVSHVSTDFGLTGRMRKENIRWFPTNMEMGAYWLKHNLLVDSAEFKRCCDFYYGDTTFEEAFERTGKHVCITVTASRATSGGTAQRLLLNHISTPHVTLSSAVGASCALPGVMAPAKLIKKGSNGKQEPFEVDGVEWIDGSVQADLPFERISTLFNVSNYVVCQTNFHVMPFLNKAHHPNSRSLYWRLFQTVEWDIRSRALKLSRLGLFPRLFGQDISKVFKQKYHGNLTLVPRFTAMQTFGLKALANPTKPDMVQYLKYGQIAAWPYLKVIEDMIRIERSLDDCLARLHERRQVLSPDWDDVESIASAPSTAGKGVHWFNGSHREAERMKQKVNKLERENFSLKVQLEELRRQLEDPETTDELTASVHSNGSQSLTEKEVWNLIRLQKKNSE